MRVIDHESRAGAPERSAPRSSSRRPYVTRPRSPSRARLGFLAAAVTSGRYALSPRSTLGLASPVVSWVFTRERAEAYLTALVLWVAGFVLIIIRSGGSGHQAVTDLAGAIQLAIMFAACATIGLVALLFARESVEPRADHQHFAAFAVDWALRSGALLIGLGVPAALRTVRRHR
jgi:hypothetical protein